MIEPANVTTSARAPAAVGGSAWRLHGWPRSPRSASGSGSLVAKSSNQAVVIFMQSWVVAPISLNIMDGIYANQMYSGQQSLLIRTPIGQMTIACWFIKISTITDEHSFRAGSWPLRGGAHLGSHGITIKVWSDWGWLISHDLPESPSADIDYLASAQ